LELEGKKWSGRYDEGEGRQRSGWKSCLEAQMELAEKAKGLYKDRMT
jgi:hypothetical protein